MFMQYNHGTGIATFQDTGGVERSIHIHSLDKDEFLGMSIPTILYFLTRYKLRVGVYPITPETIDKVFDPPIPDWLDSRRNANWSEDETKDLIDMYKSKESIDKIAARHKRGLGEVLTHLKANCPDFVKEQETQKKVNELREKIQQSEKEQEEYRREIRLLTGLIYKID